MLSYTKKRSLNEPFPFDSPLTLFLVLIPTVFRCHDITIRFTVLAKFYASDIKCIHLTCSLHRHRVKFNFQRIIRATRTFHLLINGFLACSRCSTCSRLNTHTHTHKLHFQPILWNFIMLNWISMVWTWQIYFNWASNGIVPLENCHDWDRLLFGCLALSAVDINPKFSSVVISQKVFNISTGFFLLEMNAGTARYFIRCIYMKIL